MSQIARKDTAAMRGKSRVHSTSLEAGRRLGEPALSQEEQSETLSLASLVEVREMKERLSLIDREIQEYLRTDQGEPAILYEAAHHLIAAGGKRLRSLITLLCCEAVRGDIEKALPIALVEELLQTASLIHDDIVDDGETRRGVETVHRRFGRDTAILAGDLLILQAIHILGEHGNPSVIARIGACGVRVCEGEAADLLISTSKAETLDRRQYFEMIARKTAGFLRDAAGVGALIGNATEEQEEALSRYGEMLGYAFQLRDDILDIESNIGVARKTTRADLRLKRGNYLLIRTKEVASGADWQRCLEALERGDLDIVVAIAKKTALADAYELARSYATQAKQAIQGQQFRTQELLEGIADYTVARTS